MYAALSGSKFFRKLDLSHACAQLNVDAESREYLTISTHKGLSSYTKLPYGVKSAPKIFQAKMDVILHGVPNCVCKQDDILIGSVSWEENIKILSEVLERLHQYNIHLKTAKCEFLKWEVVYLGLKIYEEGLHPVDEKVNAVKGAPVPQNVKELRPFLGMVQYYHPFLPDLATTIALLHELLKKGVQWAWTRECQQAYEACKQNLTSDALLVHYDGNCELRLAIEIGYKSSEDHANCDALSRLPHEDCTVGSESAVYSVSAIDDDFPITAEDIRKATLEDHVLSKVNQFVMSGWTEECRLDRGVS